MLVKMKRLMIRYIKLHAFTTHYSVDLERLAQYKERGEATNLKYFFLGQNLKTKNCVAYMSVLEISYACYVVAALSLV